ncbi:hypothetical protein BHE74_00016689 [Ensete ventricosum]|nr:hypothetical protein GW17_00005005 [Ensete ventricosum]RWW75289.1 hypothetical protein BHE74_00016689 [Ensete ventricosum]RZR87671.1 hypothetical protein BHM03_00015125 [Ensete ventricosum]
MCHLRHEIKHAVSPRTKESSIHVPSKSRKPDVSQTSHEPRRHETDALTGGATDIMIATVGCSQKITAVDLESDVRTFGATAANEAGGPPVPGGRVGVRPVPGAENVDESGHRAPVCERFSAAAAANERP